MEDGERRKQEKLTSEYYNVHSDEYVERTVNIEMNPLYEKFCPLLPNGSSILDAGCGSGRDSRYFIDQGYRVQSFDASEEMVRISSEFTGQKTRCLQFKEMDYSEEFDGIWSSACLLHVPDEDLELVFGKFLAALKSNAYWLMTFKKGKDEGVEGGRYFNYHTEQSLRKLIEKFPDLQVIDFSEEDSFDMGRDLTWIQVVLRKNPR